MVWLISFLTVSNIAIGYGLAVYFQQHYGSAVASCGALRFRKSQAPSAPAVATEVQAVSPALASEAKAKVAEAEKPKQVETGISPAPVVAEEVGGLPPVDEENVLAGIEEFRSQLAKMNVAAEEGRSESAVKEVEPELIVAAN